MMHAPNYIKEDSICALSTVAGNAAIALIRVSGSEAHAVVRKIFTPAKKHLKNEMETGKLIYGSVNDGGKIIDHVLTAFFFAPDSYTGENMAEINCHGSNYIQKRILEMLVHHGLRLAAPGEFTLRAFLNGKMSLSHAEAVADLIASNSFDANQLALKQMRKGFSDKISRLRAQLVQLASLLELELDFSEEDVEFASRDELLLLLNEIKSEITELKESFRLGNVMKTGIPVAITGKTNVGKSTLLNALLNEDKAIVSEIPGTTRDTIEDSISIQGTHFRFIDTAGLRKAKDDIENMGIERTYRKIDEAEIILYVVDINNMKNNTLDKELNELKARSGDTKKKFIIVANKTDLLTEKTRESKNNNESEAIFISAKNGENLQLLIDALLRSVEQNDINNDIIISNARHYEALSNSLNAVQNCEDAIHNQISPDLYATDIRDALYHLGLITGEVTTNEILGNIFGKFCIGK